MLLCLLSDLQQRAFVLQISVRIGLQTVTYHGWKWGRGGMLLNFLGEFLNTTKHSSTLIPTILEQGPVFTA